MRTPSKKQEDARVEVDIRKPISKTEQDELIATAKDGDCFTKEWDGLTIECRGCSDFKLCGILFNRGTEKKIAVLEEKAKEEGAIFLDQCDFELVDREKLKRVLTKKAVAGIDFQLIVSAVAEMANTSDNVAAELYTNRLLKEFGGFKVEEGVIYVK